RVFDQVRTNVARGAANSATLGTQLAQPGTEPRHRGAGGSVRADAGCVVGHPGSGTGGKRVGARQLQLDLDLLSAFDQPGVGLQHGQLLLGLALDGLLPKGGLGLPADALGLGLGLLALTVGVSLAVVSSDSAWALARA